MATVEEWWSIIRRAYGVPDIVSHLRPEPDEPTNAERAVAWRLLGPPENVMPLDLRAHDEARAITLTRTLAERGATGILDQYLVPFGFRDREEVPSYLLNWSHGDI